MSNPFSRRFFFLYLTLLVICTFFLSRQPGHNGDLPFYIYCAIEKSEGGPPTVNRQPPTENSQPSAVNLQPSTDKVLEQTVAVLKKELPPGEYQAHADRLAAASPAIFDYYRIKPLYLLLIIAFHDLGCSWISALQLISLLAFFLIGISCWRFGIQKLEPWKTFLLGCCCVLIYPTLLISRLSTPDALSTYILLNALMLIYFRRSKKLWFSLFVLAVCLRFDNVISAEILLFGLWICPLPGFPNKLKNGEFVFFSGLLILTALLVNFSSTRHLIGIRGPYEARSVLQYVANLKWYYYAFSGSFFVGMAIFFVFSGFIRGFSWKDESNYFFYLITALVLIRVLLYPFYEERLLTPFLIFLILLSSFQFAGSRQARENGGFNPL